MPNPLLQTDAEYAQMNTTLGVSNRTMRCTRFRLLVLSLILLPSTVILAQPYQGPIIDAHGHLGASFNWEIMVEVMDRNNVTHRTVMARYYPVQKVRATCQAVTKTPCDLPSGIRPSSFHW